MATGKESVVDLGIFSVMKFLLGATGLSSDRLLTLTQGVRLETGGCDQTHWHRTGREDQKGPLLWNGDCCQGPGRNVLEIYCWEGRKLRFICPGKHFFTYIKFFWDLKCRNLRSYPEKGDS